MSVMIERAKWLARLVHEGETRRNGEPYYMHCERVEEALKDRDEIIRSAALMHDVLENAKNPDIIRTLMLEYFPSEVSYLVEVLTNDKNLYYNKYIDVVSNNPKALLIKFEDLKDNTKDNNIPEKQFNKYREACVQIMMKGIDVPEIIKEKLNINNY